MEVRVGADVPPEYKKVSRNHRREVRTPSLEMCGLLTYLQVLTHLTNLVLKDVTNTELESVLTCCGDRLARLEIHYMSTGLDLSLINRYCSCLLDLNICNSRLYLSHDTTRFLPRLEQCRLMRVCYDSGAENIFLSLCEKLRVVHQEAGQALDDQLIHSLISRHSLQALGHTSLPYLFSLSCITLQSNLSLTETVISPPNQFSDYWNFPTSQSSETSRTGA